MVSLFNSVAPKPAKPEGYTTYQEPDTRVPPKAKPVLNEISVNGVAIAEAEILAEAQNHPAENPGAAVLAAARALTVRQLLLQEAERNGLLSATTEDGGEGRSETPEDAAIRLLIEQEVNAPAATDQECRRFYENNQDRFQSEPVFEARHILIAADSADRHGRHEARDLAAALIARLAENPAEFDDMARDYSACPSREHGGNLGQLTKGGTVAEFETALKAMREGETSAAPVESRYGFHIIRLERKIDGKTLPFELARERIAAWLEAAAWSKAVSQYIAILAAAADIRGIDILAAESPLVQ